MFLLFAGSPSLGEFLFLNLDIAQFGSNTKTIIKDENSMAYYDKTQMEKIRAIHEQITSNLQERVTIEELSKQYDMPATSMKKCFREIYGDSIYSYQKRYRMNVAANLLMEDSKVEIQEIALKMGYENLGKFSSTFKSVKSVTPAKYRKH